VLSYLLQKTLVVDDGVVFSHSAFPPLFSWTVDKQKKGRTKYIFAIEVCISSILATGFFFHEGWYKKVFGITSGPLISSMVALYTCHWLTGTKCPLLATPMSEAGP